MAEEKIEGYNEFIRDTNKIANELPKEMARSSVDMATEWVQAAQSNTSTTQEQLAAQMLHAMSSGDGAEIECNSPLFYGTEFGGQGRPETMQFPPFNGSKGYWFYPARRSNEDRFMDIWDKGIENAMSAWDRHG